MNTLFLRKNPFNDFCWLEDANKFVVMRDATEEKAKEYCAQMGYKLVIAK